MRFLLIQDIGVKYIIESVLFKLKANTLVEGNLYKGDLLMGILNLSDENWKDNEKVLEQLFDLVKKEASLIITELGLKEYDKIISKFQ